MTSTAKEPGNDSWWAFMLLVLLWVIIKILFE
jgi:hypothetical protein